MSAILPACPGIREVIFRCHGGDDPGCHQALLGEG